MAKVKAAENSAQKTPAVESQYVVKTQGYQETFRNLEDAKSQYDFLKKRSVKNQESIKLELNEVGTNGQKKVLENVSIGDEFFK